MKKLLFSILLTSIAFALQAQKISTAGSIGWNIPGGSGVGSGEGQYDVGGGITFGFDLMYHLNDEDPKLGVGIVWNRSVLANSNILGDSYGLSVIGLKSTYHMKSKGFSPFAGLSLGLGSLSTPEISVNDQVVAESQSSSGIAIMPQVGLAFGGLQLSLDYLLPSNFKIEEAGVEGKLGSMVVSLGYRLRF